jgi:hypothetical protein
LATVRYEANPARSLTLLKSGTKTEWFRQGEKAGHLMIDEVRDGSVVFSENGRQQVLSVPVKNEKSLLKNAPTAVAAVPVQPAVNPAIASRGNLRQPSQPPAAIQRDLPVQTAAVVQPPQTAAQPVAVEPEAAETERLRAEPPPPTPEEQMQSLDSTITGIQEIMNTEDGTLSEEERRAQQELWKELLSTLKDEKASLEAASKNPPAKTESADKAQPAEKEAAAPEEAMDEAGSPPAVEGEGEGAVVPEAAPETESNAVPPPSEEGEGQEGSDEAETVPNEY